MEMNPELGRKATNDEVVGQTTLPDILFVRPSLQMNFKLTISVCSSTPIIFSCGSHQSQVPKMNVFEYKVAKNADNTESSTVGVHYMVTHNTFARGKVKVRFVKFGKIVCP